MLIPPINFSLVAGEIWRSGHPIELNYPFLETLNLRTIVYVGDRSEDDNTQYREWAENHRINFVHIKMPSVKEPFILNDPVPVQECLGYLLDQERYPLLVHSNKGKHRVGVLVGVLRKLQGWALASIYEEYIRFSKGKAEADLLFIEQYDLELDGAAAPEWLRASD